MTQMNSMSPGARRLAQLSKLRRVAMCILDGPRAVMFPDDPKGLKLWLEPIVAMKSRFATPKRTVSLIIFSVPNCLNRDDSSPLLVRQSVWEYGLDRTAVFADAQQLWPSVQTVYQRMPVETVLNIDQRLREMDKALVSFPFPIEGLDLSGPSESKALPPDAKIVEDAISYNKLWRRTRLGYTEISWKPVKELYSKLDLSWQELFKALASIIESVPSGGADMVEKYDIAPRDYDKLLRA